jgi:putative methionine-R-sulfoxide reductase with GAF domain
MDYVCMHLLVEVLDSMVYTTMYLQHGTACMTEQYKGLLREQKRAVARGEVSLAVRSNKVRRVTLTKTEVASDLTSFKARGFANVSQKLCASILRVVQEK